MQREELANNFNERYLKLKNGDVREFVDHIHYGDELCYRVFVLNTNYQKKISIIYKPLVFCGRIDS